MAILASVDYENVVTLGNILVALTVITSFVGIVALMIRYGTRVALFFDILLRIVAWYSKSTGYPIPKELAQMYQKVNGNVNHPPLPHDSGECDLPVTKEKR